MSTLSYSAIISERSQNGREPSDLKGVRPKFEVRNLSFWYGANQALFDVSPDDPGALGGRPDRAVGLRQIDVPARRSTA